MNPFSRRYTSAEWTFTPADGFTGVDKLAFVAKDGFGNSEPAVNTITVTPAGRLKYPRRLRDRFGLGAQRQRH
jgi:hypothetical protein